ncbi:MAG TPA: nucleoside transporter C-terminal domain-containing protein, partial [Planctomycetota bacterium]|nr:nucleoside transporter C-terminal domain-containing protein [Planctomycetota bacterium]
GGLALQLALAALLLGTDVGRGAFEWAAQAVTAVIAMAKPGAELVFGSLADPQAVEEAFGERARFVFAFAGTGLVAIIFFSALMAVLYHLGVMQVVVWAIAKLMAVTLRVSGAEATAMAANVFVGQTEAPLVVRPYLATLTPSELNALMTGGFATIAGSVLAIYMGLLGPEIGPHLLTASVLAAPGAFVMAKLVLPESARPETGGRVELRFERSATNVIDAAAVGTTDGLRLYLNVVAMLIAFTGLIALADWGLGAVSGNAVVPVELSLGKLFGWAFAPVAWFVGVDGWHDCQRFGSLLGTKLALNEFVAFAEMQAYLPGSGAEGAFESARAAKLAAYALCGFANFASIGIQIGGIGALVPERRAELSRLALRAMLGGALASCSTAAVGTTDGLRLYLNV